MLSYRITQTLHRGQVRFPVRMLEAKQSLLLRYQLARCYSMAAAAAAAAPLEQVNKTRLRSGDYDGFTHKTRTDQIHGFSRRRYLASCPRCSLQSVTLKLWQLHRE